MTIQELLAQNANGDDIHCIVGLGIIKTAGGTSSYATAIVCYDECESEVVQLYDAYLENEWETLAKPGGLLINRLGPSAINVETTKRCALIGMDNQDIHHQTSASWWATMTGSPRHIDEFFHAAGLAGFWVLHLRIQKSSILYVVNTESGAILDQKKIPKMTISEGG